MTRCFVRERPRRGQSRRLVAGSHACTCRLAAELAALRRRADLTIPEAISTVLSRPRYGSSGLLSWRRTEPLWVMLGERTCTE